MSYEIKLRTGFFESSLFSLSVSPGLIQFIPIESTDKSSIIINEKDLVAITLLKNKTGEIDIETYNQILTGTFTKKIDLKKVVKDFKKNINKKIYYEEE